MSQVDGHGSCTAILACQVVEDDCGVFCGRSVKNPKIPHQFQFPLYISQKRRQRPAKVTNPPSRSTEKEGGAGWCTGLNYPLLSS